MKNNIPELKDTELENVNGGVCATFDQPRASGKIPKINPDEKFVMGVDTTDSNIVGTCGPTSSEK